MNPLYLKKKPLPYTQAQQYNTVNINKTNIQNAALKGHIMKNSIKKEDIYSDIIISAPPDKKPEKSDKKSAFDIKKALKPLFISSGIAVGSILAISSCVAGYSKVMASDKGLVRAPDLPRCMNIVEEYHLAMYKALQNPTGRNILGLIGVMGFSALTLALKSFVDGAKEVWVKKQNCDINYDLQESLIEVEANAFKGKIDAANSLLAETSDYFRKSINFKGKKEKPKKQDTKINPIVAGLSASVGFCALGFLLYKNYTKIASNLNVFKKNNDALQIQREIQKAQGYKDKTQAIVELKDVLNRIDAPYENMKEELLKIEGVTSDEAGDIALNILQNRPFVKAPEALGGVSNKIQYYCYINEERGHLYNWILNPENKWNKYLFLSFCFVSSLSYIAKSAADAIKQVVVARENSKSEYELRKKLIDVEIDNFKTKKKYAIEPFVDNFKQQLQKGKSKAELEELSRNILLEIKNGPPYVYN